jgi:hypothetical protein
MGVGYVALLSLLLLLAGSWSAVREKRGLLLLWGGIILGPILMSLQGVSVPSWAYARYLIFSLPLLLILMAEGIDWLAIHVWMGKDAAVVAWGLTAIVVLGWMPLVHAQFIAKEEWPYARVATFLHTQMQKSDVIVAGRSVGLSLSQFFDDFEDRIMLPDSYVSKIANNLDGPLSGRIFYVTGPGSLKDRKAPVRRFGRLEVTIYGGDTARGLLQQWRADLLLRTAGHIAVPFQGDYQLLAVLEAVLPSGHSADQWRSMAESCRVQRPSTRYIPRHLQKAVRSVAFP